MRSLAWFTIIVLFFAYLASDAHAANKGDALPERTVELVVDVDNRFIEDEFGGDADAARIYVTNVLFAVRVILNQDLNITLSVKEIVLWEAPAPFELDASEDPSFTDVFSAYYEYVEDNRADSLPAMFQLFTGYLTSFSGLRSLAFAGRPCDGVSALAAFASDTFPAGPGSLDVIFSARGLGRNLGAATNTTEPSVMGATITSSTPLLFLPESITAIANRLAVGDCWAPVVMEGEGETTEGEGETQPTNHSADINLDFVINLSELLRVVQLFNSQGHHCGDANSEDGYVAGVDLTAQECPPHDSDFDPQDWRIFLSELLRLIQFYNAEAYTTCPAGEDGYCPGV